MGLSKEDVEWTRWGRRLSSRGKFALVCQCKNIRRNDEFSYFVLLLGKKVDSASFSSFLQHVSFFEIEKSLWNNAEKHQKFPPQNRN